MRSNDNGISNVEDHVLGWVSQNEMPSRGEETKMNIYTVVCNFWVLVIRMDKTSHLRYVHFSGNSSHCMTARISRRTWECISSIQKLRIYFFKSILIITQAISSQKVEKKQRLLSGWSLWWFIMGQRCHGLADDCLITNITNQWKKLTFKSNNITLPCVKLRENLRIANI